MVNIDYVDNLFNNNNRILETIRKMVKVTLELPWNYGYMWDNSIYKIQ